MSNTAKRRTPLASRELLSRWRGVAICFLVGLNLAGGGPASLPDSVRPCLPCHSGGERDQIGEWLESPYSETEGGRGCVDCHGRSCLGNPDARVLGSDTGLQSESLQEAARLTVTAICSDSAVEAEVAVSNVGVGHLLPTGAGERTLILEVAAHDRNRTPLTLWEGSRHPRDAGPTAGGAGRLFVKNTLPGSSTTFKPRLLPFATDVSRYRFVPPEDGSARVSARLILASAAAPRLEIASTATDCRPSGETP
jgi:hypothetical protein